MRLIEQYPDVLPVSVEATRYREHAELARQHDVSVMFLCDVIEISKTRRVIRIHKQHIIYLKAMIRFFEFYWESVEPRDEFGKMVCDFTPHRYHRMLGFDLMPVLFPSLAEPVSTIDQYLDFARLEQGQTVIDLGAYAGLSSMLFSCKVGAKGRVIALEPDPENYRCANINLDMFNRLTGFSLELLNAALWVDDAGLDFSADGCMGSSAVEYVGTRGHAVRVETITLEQLAYERSIGQVDFLKCDIEGAENKVFENSSFLKTSVRKMVVEIHRSANGLTSDTLLPQLQCLGFRCELVTQYGVDLPLLLAVNPRL